MNVPRGQNLVLLSMALFLLTLMVLTTLGIASRVRENHELQTVADAAAFSNAVVTARTYNNEALANRLGVSYWVAMAADESLISWTSYTRAALAAAVESANNLTFDPCPGNQIAANNLLTALGNERVALIGDGSAWDTGDEGVAAEMTAIQGIISGLRGEMRDGPDGATYRLLRERGDQQVAVNIVNQSKIPGLRVIGAGGGFVPTSGPGAVSRREAGCKWDGSGDLTNAPVDPARSTSGKGTGLCGDRQWNDNQLEAALGSRTKGFLRFRSDQPSKLADIWGRLASVGGVVSVVDTGHDGEGYFSDFLHGGNNSTYAYADDEGSVTVTVRGAGCPVAKSWTTAAKVHVRTTDKIDPQGQHQYSPVVPGITDPDPKTRHMMGSCLPGCPSVWVRWPSFLPDNGAADLFGQPKNMVAIERDYADPAYARPWDLNFRFKFGQSAGSRFDNRGERLKDGTAIARAVAVATGLTYYHRPQGAGGGGFGEFPNLLNPFWRATLVPVHADRGPGAPSASSPDVLDVHLSLNQGAEQNMQADAYEQLVLSGGFKGLH